MLPAPVSKSLVLTGPTASGKTGLAIELARTAERRDRLDGLDGPLSPHGHRHRQADCRTAPAGAASSDRRAGSVGIGQRRLVAGASEAHCCREIESRGKQVLFVGGTPLYLKALMFGLFDGPAADLDLRAPSGRGSQPARSGGIARAAGRGRSAGRRAHPRQRRAPHHPRPGGFRVDGPADQRAGKRNGLRDGESARAVRSTDERPACLCSPCLLWLDLPRHELYERINRRVEEMFDGGLVEEALALRRLGRPLEQGSVPGRRLYGGLRPSRRTVHSARGDRAGADSHPAVRQTANYLVSPSSGLPAGHIGIDMEALATQNE